MKYPKGTFTQNMAVAIKYKDDDMIADLFADQTTDIALKQPEALNAALKNAGIFVTDSLDPKYLVELVADNWSNKKLLQNIVLMITDLNTPKDKDPMVESKNLYSETDPVAAIAGAIGADDQKKAENKKKMLDYLDAKANPKPAVAPATTGNAPGKAKAKQGGNKSYVPILAFFTVIAIGVYLYRDSLKTA